VELGESANLHEPDVGGCRGVPDYRSGGGSCIACNRPRMDVDYLLTMRHQDGDHEVLHNASVYREPEGRCSMSWSRHATFIG
jgi:hypothetical protein